MIATWRERKRPTSGTVVVALDMAVASVVALAMAEASAVALGSKSSAATAVVLGIAGSAVDSRATVDSEAVVSEAVGSSLAVASSRAADFTARNKLTESECKIKFN